MHLGRFDLANCSSGTNNGITFNFGQSGSNVFGVAKGSPQFGVNWGGKFTNTMASSITGIAEQSFGHHIVSYCQNYRKTNTYPNGSAGFFTSNEESNVAITTTVSLWTP